MKSDAPTLPTCTVLGSALALTDYAGAVAWVRQRAREPRTTAVAAANTHVVTLARHDHQFGEVMSRFDLLLPDGMPLVWCINAKLKSSRLTDRVYGPTFMLRCLEATAGEASHFFLGGTDELLTALERKLRERVPRLQISGSYAPPFGAWSAPEEAVIRDRLLEARANFVWVGLGCPKQERWISRQKERLPPGVYTGVGAAFAFHAGKIDQAPDWLQRWGLEWAFRLATEPRRLGSRYLKYNTLFVLYLMEEALRHLRRRPRRPAED